jgi:tRNA (guanine37-N1)-methyltransferase
MFDSYLNESILKRAIDNKKIVVKFYDPKDFEPNKKKRIDDRPYGGGPGMVIRPLPVIKAIEKAIGKKKKVEVIFLSPGGKQFTNELAETCLKKHSDIVIVSGRYEGIDARVKKIFKAKEISVGPFVTTGGELPAMIIIDVMSRRIPGVLGKHASIEENRVAAHDVYTRPEKLVYKKKNYNVPKVLLSGHRAKMDEWKVKENKKAGK